MASASGPFSSASTSMDNDGSSDDDFSEYEPPTVGFKEVTKQEQIYTSDKVDKRTRDRAKTIAILVEEDKQQAAATVSEFGDYRLGEILGRGSYGRVFKGLSMATGQCVAVKEIPLTSSTMMATELPIILGEIQLLRDLHHPNVVEYLDYHMIENQCLYIVIEFVENGSLKDNIKKFGHFPEKLSAHYCKHILKGLEYIHGANIIHCDIKGANILVTKEGICKIADFGVAKKEGEGECDSKTAAGTTYWMAPEVFEARGTSKGSDIWSLGCTVLEMIDGAPPYRSFPKQVAVCKIMENDFPPFPKGISKDLIDFLHCCFHKDPEKRSTATSLLDHPWLSANQEITTRKSSFRDCQNIYDVLASFNKTPDITKDEINTLVQIHSQVLVQRIAMLKKKQSKNTTNDTLDTTDAWRLKYRELEIENSLLLKAARFIQENLSRQLLNISVHLQQSHSDLVESEQRKRSIAKKIEILEESFVSVQSDTRLCELIYGDQISISHFTRGTRGVLLVKRAPKQNQILSTEKYKWKKRWILLQDNFLLCYKADEEELNPVLVFRLQNHVIVPVPEREIGKQHVFKLTAGKKIYYFAAANLQVFLKWIENLMSVSSWFLSEDLLLENGKTEKKRKRRLTSKISEAPHQKHFIQKDDRASAIHAKTLSLTHKSRDKL